MTKSTKVLIGVCLATGLLMAVWIVGFGCIVTLLNIPSLVTGIISFTVVFGFLQSPWYTSYTDWVEDQLEKVIK